MQDTSALGCAVLLCCFSVQCWGFFFLNKKCNKLIAGTQIQTCNLLILRPALFSKPLGHTTYFPHRVSFIVMEAATHQYNWLATQQAKHQFSLMTSN